MRKQSLYSILLLLLHSAMLSAQCWELVWADEFDGTALKSANWTYDLGGNGWGNEELQHYTDRPTNIQVADGTLRIIARAENFQDNAYTSARLVTRGRQAFAYGKISARIKLPKGQGIWPAFWMLPEDQGVYGGWPFGGEIDIMEMVGNLPARLYGTSHAAQNGRQVSFGGFTDLPQGIFNDGFHEFSVEWTPGTIRHFLDGRQYLVTTNSEIKADPWPFDRAFHLLLNVAVGGRWPGRPDATTTFPQVMEVDWVRVHQQVRDVTIIGPEQVEAGATGSVYTAPRLAETTYEWTVPAGVDIVSGQGTPQITVNWNNQSGDLRLAVRNACGSGRAALSVISTVGLWANPAFERDLQTWSFRTDGTARGTIAIVTSDVQEGKKAAQVTVTASGTNPWDLQLTRPAFAVTPGERYRLRFWAKAATTTRFAGAFIDPARFTWLGGADFTATPEWREFSIDITMPTGQERAQFNLDLARTPAVFTFDHFIFERATPPLSATVLPPAPQVTLMPNPIADVFYLRSEAPVRAVSVTDALGRKVQQYTGPFEPDRAFSLPALPQGAYWVTVIFDENAARTLLIEKR